MWPMFYKITAIAKKELFYAMPFGLTAWLCGTRFIDRRNPDRAKASMNAALEYVKEESVCRELLSTLHLLSYNSQDFESNYNYLY